MKNIPYTKYVFGVLTAFDVVCVCFHFIFLFVCLLCLIPSPRWQEEAFNAETQNAGGQLPVLRLDGSSKFVTTVTRTTAAGSVAGLTGRNIKRLVCRAGWERFASKLSVMLRKTLM